MTGDGFVCAYNPDDPVDCERIGVGRSYGYSGVAEQAHIATIRAQPWSPQSWTGRCLVIPFIPLAGGCCGEKDGGEDRQTSYKTQRPRTPTIKQPTFEPTHFAHSLTVNPWYVV